MRQTNVTRIEGWRDIHKEPVITREPYPYDARDEMSASDYWEELAEAQAEVNNAQGG